MNIVIVRHVETYGNIEGRFNGITESEYTEDGFLMKEALLKELVKLNKTYEFEKIYCSPTRRVADTAESFAELIKKPLYYAEDLKEYNFGIFDGLKIEDCIKNYPELYEEWSNNHIHVKLPEGDSYYEKYLRAEEFLEGIIKEDNDSSVILFTHGATFRCLLTKLLSLPIESGWHFNIGLGAYCIISYDHNYGVLYTLNNSISNKKFIKNFVK